MQMQDTDWQLETLESWVMENVERWKDHIEANYYKQWEEYNRLWRSQWSAEDKNRESERSRLISPALQQAVESSVAEIEEATFGRGRWFDIRDDEFDDQKEDVEFLKKKLYEDFQKIRVRTKVAECLITSAVFGTGIGEIVATSKEERAPAQQGQYVGVMSKDRIYMDFRPVHVRNFVINPEATTIEDAMGVAIDEFVPLHYIVEGQEAGIYRNEYVGTSAPDSNLEVDPSLTNVDNGDRVRLTKYYGLVPRELLKEEADLLDKGDSEYIEACVVIANGDTILKAMENPYMMKDRPVVAFSWDVVPGRFWGRGVCEKGYMSQKALDAELRARVDALALTTSPMMGVDATRYTGKSPKVMPGRSVLTQGPPNEILHPFHFGQVDQITFAQASELQKMVQMATGAVDSAGIAGSINGEATAAGISMSLGAIIKRHKRTLLNFQENFLIPLVEKTAWRYMQYDPDNYPVNDYKFHASSTLGIMAREYEVTQMVQLLQTMSPDTPVYPVIIEAIIDNMNITNREQLIKGLKQALQPTPEQQAQQQAQMQQAQEMHQVQVEYIRSQTYEANKRGDKYREEASTHQQEVEIDMVQAAMNNLNEREDKAATRRLKEVETFLKWEKNDK